MFAGKDARVDEGGARGVARCYFWMRVILLVGLEEGF